MLGQLTRLLFPAEDRRAAQSLYLALVGQSRKPFFFSGLEVPDTLDGRFELILLHAFLMLHRLKASHGGKFDEAESKLERQVIEALFADMDRSLREFGVGDTGVSRRVKAMANAFYGRLHAYESALSDDSALKEALTRNLYGTVTPSETTVATMATYVRASIEMLRGQADGAIQAAELAWPGLETLAGGEGR